MIRWITDPMWQNLEPIANLVDLPIGAVVAFIAAVIVAFVGLNWLMGIGGMMVALPYFGIQAIRAGIGGFAIVAIADFYGTAQWEPFGIELMAESIRDQQRLIDAAILTGLLIASFWVLGLNNAGFNAEQKIESFQKERRAHAMGTADGTIEDLASHQFGPQRRYRRHIAGTLNGMRLGNGPRRFRDIFPKSTGITGEQKDDAWRDATNDPRDGTDG